MKNKVLILFSFLFSLPFLYGQGGVGINTTNPQQKLHIAYPDTGAWNPLGLMRVESLNSTNNPFNAGDLDGNGNEHNDLYPLYVDENGDFTLEFTPSYNSGEFDALNDLNLPTSSVYLPSTDANGNESTIITSYEITVNRPSIMEFKYILSCNVYLNPAKDIITDNLARNVVTYISVSGTTRTYGAVSNCYSSGSQNSVSGTLYFSSSSFIQFSTPGVYTITLNGFVASMIKAGSTSGDPSESTYVEFATGEDFVFYRLH